MSLLAELAREYRTQYPDKPTKALARILYAEQPLLFKDAEAARKTLRYIEGKTGKASKAIAQSEFYREEPRPYNPYKLPGSDEQDMKPFVVKGHKRVLILNDIHLPFHSIEAITCCFDWAKKEKPDALLLNGDVLDFYKLSAFCKDPRERNFKYELDQFREFFQILEKTFRAKIYFKLGNHEIRYEHYLFQKAGELVGVEEFELENIIKARANGITVIGDKQIVRLNELNVIHGHEFGRGFFSPVNAARGLQLRANVSALQGDCHATSEHTVKDLEGRMKTTWSVGALCGLTPKYAPYNKWNWGFALVDLAENRKDFFVQNKRIFHGKVY